jgi:hypothetical protein
MHDFKPGLGHNPLGSLQGSQPRGVAIAECPCPQETYESNLMVRVDQALIAKKPGSAFLTIEE